MKNTVLIVLSLCLVTIGLLPAQEKTVWDYPVKPGVKEWTSLETNEQMINVCQIPPEILNQINTAELIKICLNYPLLNNYMAFNNERAGIDATISQFNGLQELSRRKDCIQELLKTYASYPVLSQVQTDVQSINYHIPYKLPFLELLLSSDAFVTQINNDNLQNLLQIVANKYTKKLQNFEVYSLFNIKKTMLLAAIVMKKQNKTEGQHIVDKFIEEYNNLAPNTITEMSKLINIKE